MSTVLYLTDDATSSPFPTTSRLLSYDGTDPTVVQLVCGYFDSGQPGSTDAGQWNPDAALATTTLAAEIALASNSTRQGWLLDDDLVGSAIAPGNWSVTLQIRLAAGASAFGANGRIALRASVVTGSSGAYTTIARLLTGAVAGGVGHRDNWRSHEGDAGSPPGIVPTSTLATFTRTIETACPTGHVFSSGERLLIELGFCDAGNSTDRAWELWYGGGRSYITVPDFVPAIVGDLGSGLPLPKPTIAAVAKHQGGLSAGLLLPAFAAVGAPKHVGSLGASLLAPRLDAAGALALVLEGSLATGLPVPGLAADGLGFTEIEGVVSSSLSVPVLVSHGLGYTDVVGPLDVALPLPVLEARQGTPAVLGAAVRPYVRPSASPLSFSDALLLVPCPALARVFLMCGRAVTGPAPTDVWAGAEDMQYPVSATAVAVTSTSGDDTSAGQGARAVEILGWDENWVLTRETLELAGTSSVATTAMFWRIIQARVIGAGAAAHNVGTLDFAIDSQAAAIISPGENASLQPQFTVPPGHIGYVYDWRVSAAKSGGEIDFGLLQFLVRPQGAAFYPVEHLVITAGAALSRTGPLLVAEPGSDVTVRAWTNGAGSNRRVASSYSIAIIPEA